MSTVSVLIVNWNAGAVIERCLRNVLVQDVADSIEVIIVDNASVDDSLDRLERFPAAKVITSPHNLGFARAINLAARSARGDIFVLLNPDAIFVSPTAITDLVESLNDPSVGLVGPLLLNVDGSVQPSAAPFPSLLHSLTMACGLHFIMSDRLRERFAPSAWSQGSRAETDWLRGAVLVMRASDYRAVGGFSEATFMYGEDLELAYRVRKRGLKVVYEPGTQVLHLSEHSTSQRWTPAQRGERIAAGDVQFLKNHYPWWRQVAIRLITASGFFARSAVYRVLRRPEKWTFYLAAAKVAWPSR